jgi:hypothetical protein
MEYGFFVDFWNIQLVTRFISFCVVSFADLTMQFHLRTIMCQHKPSLKIKEGYDKPNTQLWFIDTQLVKQFVLLVGGQLYQIL